MWKYFSRLGRPSSEIFFFKTWFPKFWNVTFSCNTMSPSLDNDCAIQDLAFQVLKLFGVKTFNIRPLPRIGSFMTRSPKTWTHVEIFFKTWQPQFWNLTFFSRLGIPSFEMLLFLQHHAPKSWQWLHYSRLGFPSLETFRGKEFQHQTLAKNYAFHDLVSQDMNTCGNIFQDLAATVLKSYIFFQDLVSQVLKCYIFLQHHVPKSWQWLRYSRLGFPSLETFRGTDFQH